MSQLKVRWSFKKNESRGTNEMIASFLIGKKCEQDEGELIKENEKTIWVRLQDKNIIKRHKIKHCVAIIKVNDGS